MLIDNSSAFNTIQPNKLIIKQHDLGINIFIMQLGRAVILDLKTIRPDLYLISVLSPFCLDMALFLAISFEILRNILSESTCKYTTFPSLTGNSFSSTILS